MHFSTIILLIIYLYFQNEHHLCSSSINEDVNPDVFILNENDSNRNPFYFEENGKKFFSFHYSENLFSFYDS